MKKKLAARKQQTGFRDRIKEFVRVRIGDHEAHPENYRKHTAQQSAVVEGLLNEVGIAGVVFAFPADGKGTKGDFSRLMLYDGHLRQSLSKDQVWPTIVTDLTRKEADLMIATLHPSAELAETDEQKQQELLAHLDAEEAEVLHLLDELERAGRGVLDDDDGGGGPAQEGSVDRAAMELQPHEHYDYVVILASTAQQWNVLCERLGIEPKEISGGKRKTRIGLCRAIRADKVLTRLKPDTES